MGIEGMVRVPSSDVKIWFEAVKTISEGITNISSFKEDGKQMTLDPEVLGIKGVVNEVDRHSRILARKEELTGN